MNWDAVGAIAELVGAVAVVISLLYLATQLRRANHLARRNAVQQLLASRGELNRFLAADPKLSDLFWMGLESPNELSEAEWRRFINVVSTLVRHFEAVFSDHREGLLAEGAWRSQASSIQRWLTKPGAQQYLDEFSGDFDADFIRYLREARGADDGRAAAGDISA